MAFDGILNDLAYLDGPWRNDACMGYAMMAMKRIGLDDATIAKAIREMKWCFDDTSVEEAAEIYMSGVS